MGHCKQGHGEHPDGPGLRAEHRHEFPELCERRNVHEHRRSPLGSPAGRGLKYHDHPGRQLSVPRIRDRADQSPDQSRI